LAAKPIARRSRPASSEIDPYPVALALLAGRELSAAQVRDRLHQRGFATAPIETTLARLRDERLIDDRRTALARARQAVLVKHRGRGRAVREIEALGIDKDSARAAIDDVLHDVDEHALVERALERRRRGPIASRAEFRRLYEYLVRQGFSSALAVAALKKHARAGAWLDEGALKAED
jgi:SOS response regulatory protein OraA/RecX